MGLFRNIASICSNLFKKADIAPTRPDVINIELRHGDLLGSKTDSIANAADWTMLGGTGIDGAIHAAAGVQLGAYIARNRLRLDTCGVVSTPGFLLNHQRIFHVCTPPFDAADTQEGLRQLALCYERALLASDAENFDSIAFPLLGAGAFCWPASLAAQAMAKGLHDGWIKSRQITRIEVYAASKGALEALAMALNITPLNAAGSELPHHPGHNALSGLTVDEIDHYI